MVPPYIHILLGIIKKHHDLLEHACHTLDKQITSTLAKETDTYYENSTPFGQYMNSLKEIEKDEEENRAQENRLSETQDTENGKTK